MTARDYVLELKHIIIDDTLSDATKLQMIKQYHESDIADALQSLNREQRLKLYHLIGKEMTAEVFSYLDDVADYVDELSNENAADIIEQMDADDAVDVLEQLDNQDVQDIVSFMEDESVEDIKLISQYSDDEIGSKMTNNYILISKSNTVKEAMKKVVAQAADNDNVSVIYVEDENHKFFGALDLRDLIVARENTDLTTLMKCNYPYFYATDLVSENLGRLKNYALDSYPILDANQELIGVVTADDVVEVVTDEMEEDYAKLGGLTENEELDESIFLSVKKRIPWLIILLFLGLAQSTFISGFEAVIAALPAIVFFQTLILDMGGNIGTQSLAVTIRILANESIKKKDLVKTCLKEIRIGFFNGLLLSILSFAVVYLFLFLKKQPIQSEVFVQAEALKAAGIVAISLITAMTVCSLIGSLIPIIFMKIKVDPAVASGPFITTINDIICVLIYYGLATILFLLI